MIKSKMAFQFSVDTLENGSAYQYFWTFTLPYLQEIKQTRKKWNHFLTILRRKYPQMSGLRVFEMHRTHGLHVHLLTDNFLHVDEVRILAKSAGWGRVHVMRCKKGTGKYLSKYLGKDRPYCFKGWRLWATFGIMKDKFTRVVDVVKTTPHSKIWKALSSLLGWSVKKGNGKKYFFQRSKLVNEIYYHSLDVGLSRCLEMLETRKGCSNLLKALPYFRLDSKSGFDFLDRACWGKVPL